MQRRDKNKEVCFAAALVQVLVTFILTEMFNFFLSLGGHKVASHVHSLAHWTLLVLWFFIVLIVKHISDLSPQLYTIHPSYLEHIRETKSYSR